MTVRNGRGQFEKGNPGGPGRPPKQSPLHKAIDDDAAASLWGAELALAEGGDADARRFILNHKQGRPIQAAPETPAIAWPSVMSADDLPAAVSALLGAHAEGVIDGAALEFLAGVLGSLAKIVEVGDLGPKLRKLEEYVASVGGAV